MACHVAANDYYELMITMKERKGAFAYTSGQEVPGKTLLTAVLRARIRFGERIQSMHCAMYQHLLVMYESLVTRIEQNIQLPPSSILPLLPVINASLSTRQAQALRLTKS